jgi:hypothetical protein
MAIGNSQPNTVHSANTRHTPRHISKRFYDRFQTEYSTFLTHIKGIASSTDRDQYASLLLTRLMFLYFIQHKGFLDHDTNYLSNHLKIIQDRKDTSLNFYHDFLLILFYEGLSKQAYLPEHAAFLGNLPFLDINLFKEHQVELDNSSTVQISDEAFERIFAFFNTYSWRLDDRSTGNDNQLTPGILAYNFEKHINQKQTGAYYTQRDITDYIAKSTIIPFIFDAVEQKCPSAFVQDGPIWHLLRENPDRYIFPSVKQGIELLLPSVIMAGLEDPSRRSEWNRPAPAAFALPTETWREVVARRQGYQEIRAKLEAGTIHCINDFITYNLDMRQFAQDIIETCEEPALLQALFESITPLTVLDPTCGSGAFLLAALDILEPLYSTCLDRLDQHPPHRYSIHKSIITANLYGVDTMEEATQICKLRFFLKLLAQVERLEEIEPLPDLNSNIRTGNALIGSVRQADTYAALEQNSDVAVEYNEPRKLDTMNSHGDAYLQQENQPFHWFVEFHPVMQNGGFDVIIGNPPYLQYRQAGKAYELTNYTTLPTGNLYALTMERCMSLLAPGGRSGMIVPASATCTDGYLPLQEMLLEQSALHISSFSDQRGKLFDIPHPRLCIITYKKFPASKSVFSTPYLKPGRELREFLFQQLAYIEVTRQVKPGIIPRYGTCLEQTLHAKLHNQSHRLGDYLYKTGSHRLYYTRKLSWFVQVTPFIPIIMDEEGEMRNPSELKTLLFPSPAYADLAFVALNSNLFYWFVTTGSDCRNLNMREVLGLPLSMDEIPGTIQQDLRKLASQLASDLQAHSELRRMKFKPIGTLTVQCIFPGKSKPIIDEIDRVLAQHYLFTEEELDFIINYDSKYRLTRSYMLPR